LHFKVLALSMIISPLIEGNSDNMSSIPTAIMPTKVFLALILIFALSEYLSARMFNFVAPA